MEICDVFIPLLCTILASVICEELCSDKGTTTALTANLTCDQFLEIYADGQLIARADDPSTAHTYVFSIGVDVIALKCRLRLKQPPSGGILGSFSNGLVTDLSWKCTNEFELGWNAGNYDDRHWPQAMSHAMNKDEGHSLPWKVINNVLPNAHWIWTENNRNDSTIYCRHGLVQKCTKVKSSFFYTEPQHTDRSLDGFVVKTTYTDTETECGLQCGQRTECLSFNVQYVGTPTRKKRCELNRATKDTTLLVDRKRFRYYEVKRIFY